MSADEPIRPDPTDVLSDGEHLEWRLSALLDGELPVTEELLARAHLVDCDFCQDEFAEVMAARALVRGLGDVEPPRGTIERTMTRIQRRYQVRTGLFGLLALAVAWIVLLILLAGLNPPEVVPPIDRYLEEHRTGSIVGEGADALSEEEVADLGAPFVVPRAPDLFALHEVNDLGDDGIQIVFEGGDLILSVFQQEGTLVVEGLPADAVRREIDGEPVWEFRREEAIVVVPRQDAVFTVIGNSVPDEFVADLPESTDYTLGDRVRLSAESMLRRLGID